MTNEFRITGKHVLATLIGFFLVIITVNMIFLNYALKTFPGEKEEKSYLQGLHYNDKLAARAEQAALGWTATIEEAARANDEIRVALSITSKDGAPLTGLQVNGILSRPADASYDQAVVFKPLGDGQYVALATGGAGIWDFEGYAAGPGDKTLEFASRLVLE